MTNTNHKLHSLLSTIKTLRSDDGCPWDARQTSQSLIKYIKSECDELIDAIQNDDAENICEESGDLLYLIIMLSEINADLDNFNLSDVISSVNTKLIRRHPHVFEGTPYEDEKQLKEQWVKIKAQEKLKKSV